MSRLFLHPSRHPACGRVLGRRLHERSLFFHAQRLSILFSRAGRPRSLEELVVASQDVVLERACQTWEDESGRRRNSGRGRVASPDAKLESRSAMHDEGRRSTSRRRRGINTSPAARPPLRALRCLSRRRFCFFATFGRFFRAIVMRPGARRPSAYPSLPGVAAATLNGSGPALGHVSPLLARRPWQVEQKACAASPTRRWPACRTADETRAGGATGDMRHALDHTFWITRSSARARWSMAKPSLDPGTQGRLH